MLFQVEGKGNGIKTVIVNMVEIGKALQRPPSCKLLYYNYVYVSLFKDNGRSHFASRHCMQVVVVTIVMNMIFDFIGILCTKCVTVLTLNKQYGHCCH